MNRQIKSKIPIGIFLLGFSIFIGGCLNLADDVVPPQDLQPTELISNTPVATQTLFPEETVAEDTGALNATLGEVIVEVLDHSGGTFMDQEHDIRLEGYDDFNQVLEEYSPLTDESYALFSDVPLAEDRVFFASVSYGRAVYRSDVIQVTGDTSEIILQVQVFDTTTDDSMLTIDRVHVLIDFPSPGFVQISEIYIISNLGDATIVAGETGQPVLTFPLPNEASNLEFENGALGQRFIKTEDGFGDTVSIPPGEGVYQVLVYFNLPYQNTRLDFSQVMYYPVAAVVAMTPANQVKIKGSFLEDLGVQAIPSGEVQVYAGGDISRGDKLEFQVTGKPDILTDELVSSSDGINGYVIGIGILGVGLILAGIMLYINNRKISAGGEIKMESGDEKNQILDSIIALEDLYNEGEISEAVYLKKRQELKLRLNNLVQGK